jgi:uncharacterized protein YutE (UPF0331/DUF86 family)
MDEKLITQLRLLKNYTDILKKIKIEEKNLFLKDEILHGAAERYLQLAIESCINIGNRILSIEQFNYNLNTPQTYADIFENLYQAGILERDFSNNLKNMAKFRNKLVHVYWEIDHGFVYELLQNNLDDILKFMSIISIYIKNKSC